MDSTWFKVGSIGLLLLLGSFWFLRTDVRIDSPGKSEEGQQLSGSEASPEASVRRFLISLEKGDRDEIARQALSQEEFYQIVFPALPAARPGSNIPKEFVWNQHSLKSQIGLNRVLADYQGQAFQLEEVHFAGGETPYKGFIIHRDTRLLVEDKDGNQRQAKMFGSMIQVGSEFKIYSFIID